MAVDIHAITREYEQFKTNRATWESHWTEIAQRIMPRAAEFNIDVTPGAKRTEKIYDATAALALDRFGAAIESLLTPRASRWHSLRSTNDELNRVHAVRLYFDQVEDAIFKRRYSPAANFASQTHEVYLSLGAFGTGGIFVTDPPNDDVGLRYRVVPLSGLFIAEDETGIVDTVYRMAKMTPRQMAMKWGKDKISRDSQRKLEKDSEARIEVVHLVKPNKDRDPTSPLSIKKPFVSVWFEPEFANELEVGGYDEQPYLVSRYNSSPSEVFGRSPATVILPDIKMINEMSKTVIIAAQKVVDPPLIIADDGVTLPVNTKAGGSTFARIEGRGAQAPVLPLNTGARVDIGLDMMDQRRQTINDAFLISLFQILVDTPNMTATEVMSRAQEKGALLAPTVGRQQSEFLGPLISRELMILSRQGELPDMPPELVEAEGEYTVEYVSPLARAQRAEEGVGILRTIESIQPFAQVDPGVFDNFDLDEITRTLADINGMPQRTLTDERAMAEERQARAQQAQAAQAMEAGAQMAPAAKDGSQALLNMAQLAEGGGEEAPVAGP